MRVRTYGWLLALTLACVGGCGGEPAPDPGEPRSVEPAGTKPAEAEGPAEDPWRVVMTFDVDVEAGRKLGRVAADADAADVRTEVVDVVRRRLRGAEVGAYAVTARGPRRFEVGFAELPPERREEIIDIVLRHGTLEFLIEVLPDAEYAKRYPDPDARIGRTGVWPGSADAFEQFKKDEVAAWKRADDAGEPHVPSRTGFRLVRAAGTDGSEPRHFHVLEVQPPERAFDGRMLEDPLVSVDQMGMPVVTFRIKTEWQEAFGDWTEKNVLLPVAIVLDGEQHSAPVIQARLTTHVQITLGAGSHAERAREARALAAVLQAGALPAPPQLVSIEER